LVAISGQMAQENDKNRIWTGGRDAG